MRSHVLLKTWLDLCCVRNPSLKEEKQHEIISNIKYPGILLTPLSTQSWKCFIFLSFLYLNPGPNSHFWGWAQQTKSSPSAGFAALGFPVQSIKFFIYFTVSMWFSPYFQSNPLLVNSTTKGTMTLIFHLHFHLPKCCLVSLIPELRHFPWMY